MALRLKRRYAPIRAATQIDRTMRVVSKKACKSMVDLLAAIDLLNKELRQDEEASGHKLPDHTKIALLVRLFPERERKHRWIHNQKDFQVARANVLAVAVTERLEHFS